MLKPTAKQRIRIGMVKRWSGMLVFFLHFDISCFLNLNYYFDEIARVKRFYHVRLLKTHQYQVAFRPEFGSNLLSENWLTKKTERFLHVVGMSFSVCLTELSATALEYIINYCIFFCRRTRVVSSGVGWGMLRWASVKAK